MTPGKKLGPHEIVAPLGAGGMGEVYRARDTRLKRDVALKVLPEAFARDPGRMVRFQREAEVLASLNHPNIAAIYGVEERALVMEFVDGESPKGPMGFDDAWRIALQMADALEYAHDKGVVHRDLKPANIKVTHEGVVKLLDFGLAKAFNDPPGSGDPANSPTIALEATVAGTLLGTAAYMAPEQAKGKRVDRRADIWAWGVVLYELLTGERLFKGEDASDTLAQVLTRQPDLTRVPANARRLLQECLQKDPKLRLRDIGDAKRLLGETPAPTVIGRSWLPWAVVAVFALAAAGLGFVAVRHATEETRVFNLSALLTTEALNPGSLPAVSPDGRRIALAVPRSGLWVRDLDSQPAHLLPGTENAFFPFWSPDSRSLAFFASGKLKRIDVRVSTEPGPPLALCDAVNGRGGAWGKNDVIIFAPNPASGLMRVPANGGSPAPLTVLDPALSEASHRSPWFLPDGRQFLYTDRAADPTKSAIYAGDLNSKARHLVLAASSNAVYVPPGYLLFMREAALMAQPFDPGTARVSGDAVVIADRVDYFAGENLGHFSASQNGILAYLSGATVAYQQLTWFDRAGKTAGTLSAPGLFDRPAISPDGRTVAFDRLDLQTGVYDIWLHDVLRGNDSRFTFTGTNLFPAWSPDGSAIAFLRNPGRKLYRKAIEGSAGEELLDDPGRPDRPDDWSHDGRYVIEGGSGYNQRMKEIWVLPVTGKHQPVLYLHADAELHNSRLSPDDNWLAYVSDETKRDEVYIQSFPAAGHKRQISINGGGYPIWSRDGKELFFIGADRKMMAVEVKTGGSFGLPEALFEMRFQPTTPGFSYDVARDGRFLIPAAMEQGAGLPMTVVVNWTARMKR